MKHIIHCHSNHDPSKIQIVIYIMLRFIKMVDDSATMSSFLAENKTNEWNETSRKSTSNFIARLEYSSDAITVNQPLCSLSHTGPLVEINLNYASGK